MGVTGPYWSDQRLDALRLVGDPVADAAVAAYFAERAEAHPGALLAHMVHQGTVMSDKQSPALAKYFDDQPALPQWAEPDRIAKAQDFFAESGLLIGVALYCASLPETFAAAEGVQVLHLTARLATGTRRRIYETAQFLIDVMTPGALEVGAAGYREARRVRIVHAAVRHLILNDPTVDRACDGPTSAPRWCSEWGLPLNREDMLGTLMAFTTVVFDALPRLGVETSLEERADYLHAWKVVGALMGIPADLLGDLDVKSADELTAAIRRRQQRPSLEAQEMMGALLGLLESEMPRSLNSLPRSLVRYLVGNEVADMLAIRPSTSIDLLFDPLRRIMAAVSLIQEHNRMVRSASERLGRRMMRAFLGAERGDRRAAFSIPTQLAHRWGVAAPGPTVDAPAR